MTYTAKINLIPITEVPFNKSTMETNMFGSMHKHLNTFFCIWIIKNYLIFLNTRTEDILSGGGGE